ncbi:CHRD domain-containing protein [Salmonirosea aquatica]|uniref:CHRD domain-containing protein n=1 Tax=Salmonirosea aquatica TaxID=2654236 RepID=A0A7C9FT89_9BACT|nr:CHRD domain-containing protein [Cytophagaceae bacterium SJW1-29]
MKKMMRHFAFVLIGATLLSSLISCENDGPDESDIVKYQATINSQNTIPRSTSSAQGSAVLEYNKVTKVLTYNVTYQGLTPTAGHIHKAEPAWETGPVIIPFANVGTSPITGSATLTPEQEDLLSFGNLYINLHTTQYPQGEIRGQILPVAFGD